MENSVLLPKVTLIQAGQQQLLPQDYTNITVIQEDANSVPNCFNQYIENADRDSLYCFIPPFANFYTKTAISTMVHKLRSNTLTNIVYADSVVSLNGNISKQFLPVFHPSLLNGTIIINSPMLIEGRALLERPCRFNPLLQYLYLHIFFIDICHHVLPMHIAEHLWLISADDMDLVNDFKVIKECLGQHGT